MRRIGAGGMGVVYEALDRERSARVALKTLQRVDAAAIYRFKQEFRALAHVMHPNLVVLHELVSAGDTWFFTMELVDGVSFLAHVREAEVPLEYQPTTPSLSPPPAAPQDVTQHPAADRRAAAATVDLARLRAALTGVAAGVTALHAAGKLHRDLKPSNVLVTPGGRTVILDFGLASSRGLERWDGSADEQLVGTPAYMSPEQARSQPLGPASDWYCVGVMLYEALTGRLPFSGAPLEVLMAKQAADPPAPSGLVADVPPELDALCMELLRRDPARRPSGGEVLARLKAGGGGDRADESRRRSGAADVEAGATAAAFVGRQRQLLALGAAFEACGRGRPVAVFVQGPSGMGKTALVARFLDELRRRDAAVVLSGPCYERESVPYKALDSLVDELSRHLRRLPRAQAEALVPRDVHALGRLFPVLRRVEAIDAAPRRAFEIQDPQEVRRRAFAGLKELLARMADRRQLVLHIDDVQWGDADSAALLLELLGPPDPPALLVVATVLSLPSPSAATARRKELDVIPGVAWRDLTPLAAADAGGLERGPLVDRAARDRHQLQQP
ncbi:MAG TPA: serine/threonine-protein kinase, partial [Myxococcota bacterium]|nr:serine/threonine-protein kinase [Myxococcota bacterium]